MAGTIVTFYSYKGGTGRTMAMSNVAWVLASNGYRVLLIDWDLESPGLHRYLRPFLSDPELTRTPGLIDFLCAGQDGAGSRAKSALLENYAVRLNWPFRGGGAIDFIPAGRQDGNYAGRVNTFDWNRFHDRSGGDRLLDDMRRTFRARYDYVLIDSRAGVSDTAGICTAQMPDVLVVLFTLNRQSIDGSALVAASIRAKRGDGLRIFPVPTRIENAESERLAAATVYARQTFAPLLLHVQSDHSAIDLAQQAAYWNDVETPYVSYYAFQEIPAVFRDQPGSRKGLLAPNERIAAWISDDAVRSFQPEGKEQQRQVVEAYAFKPADVIQFDLPPFSNYRRLISSRTFQVLQRHFWQFATAVCASAIAAVILSDYLGTPVRTSELNSQLSSVSDDLRQLNRLIGESGNPDPALRAALADAIARLQALRRTLGNMPANPNSSPPRREDQPAKPQQQPARQ
jgi:cellulose biosynthesis protein BcsQ